MSYVHGTVRGLSTLDAIQEVARVVGRLCPAANYQRLARFPYSLGLKGIVLAIEWT